MIIRSLLFAALMLVRPPSTLAEKRIALLISNQAYSLRHLDLATPHRDAERLKIALERVGFSVWWVRDTRTAGELQRAISQHVERIADAGPDAVGFLYYNGHGAADGLRAANYLIPTEAAVATVNDLGLLAVPLDRITEALAKVGRMSFVVFDACRNVPLKRGSKDATLKGLLPVREQNGLLLAFATEPGSVAADASHYASALAEELEQPDLEAAQVFRRVRQKVRTATSGVQLPEYVDRREHDFHFAGKSKPEPPKPDKEPQPPKSTDRLKQNFAAWLSARIGSLRAEEGPRAGKPNDYSRARPPKAFAMCIDWNASSPETTIHLRSWGYATRKGGPSPGARAMKNCLVKEQPSCRCTIVHRDGRQVVEPPGWWLGKFASP